MHVSCLCKSLISALSLAFAAVLLPSGNVVYAGGYCDGGLASTSLFNASSSTWSSLGALLDPRYDHTVTSLANGHVLVAGGNGALSSCELLDPATSTSWAYTGSMSTARSSHTATLLLDGRVLVTGGSEPSLVGIVLASAELYDPATGSWTDTAPMATARYFHTATRLDSGYVLVAGGFTGAAVVLASAEVYNVALGTWTTVSASMTSPRMLHSALLLLNGQVLVAGGASSMVLASAELYDPATGGWTATGTTMLEGRYGATMVQLPNGNVLICGGSTGLSVLSACDLYNATRDAWAHTAHMGSPRDDMSSAVLLDGRVLVAGGGNGSVVVASSETYNLCPAGTFGLACQPCSLCQHGSLCVQDVSGTCECGANAQGQYCESCSAGYYGPTCLSCAQHCQSGGFCNEGASGNCTACLPNLAGPYCETCAPDHYGPSCVPCPFDCLNGGNCSAGPSGDGSCVCLLGYTGDSCETANCEVMGCHGNGICQQDDGTGVVGVCLCQPGWSGDFCDRQQACAFDSCENEGYCVITTASNFAECRCQPGYEGVFCEQPTGCREPGLACLNGGVCTSTTSTNASNVAVQCICPSGYIGATCATPVTVSDTTMFLLIAAIAGVWLVAAVSALVRYRGFLVGSLNRQRVVTLVLRLSCFFLATFDLASDVLFIVLLNSIRLEPQSGADIAPAFYCTLAVTALSFVVVVFVAGSAAVRLMEKDDSKTSLWFGLFVASLLCGDFFMALELIVLLLNLEHNTVVVIERDFVLLAPAGPNGGFSVVDPPAHNDQFWGLLVQGVTASTRPAAGQQDQVQIRLRQEQKQASAIDETSDHVFLSAFGMRHGLGLFVSVWLVCIFVRDLIQLAIKIIVLQATQSFDVIIIVSLTATIAMVFINTMSFISFHLLPMLRHLRSAAKGTAPLDMDAPLLASEEINASLYN